MSERPPDAFSAVIERECPECHGASWIVVADHSPECYAANECVGCYAVPTQQACPTCGGDSRCRLDLEEGTKLREGYVMAQEVGEPWQQTMARNAWLGWIENNADALLTELHRVREERDEQIAYWQRALRIAEDGRVAEVVRLSAESNALVERVQNMLDDPRDDDEAHLRMALSRLRRVNRQALATSDSEEGGSCSPEPG